MPASAGTPGTLAVVWARPSVRYGLIHRPVTAIEVVITRTTVAAAPVSQAAARGAASRPVRIAITTANRAAREPMAVPSRPVLLPPAWAIGSNATTISTAHVRAPGRVSDEPVSAP